jgi:hypothetical protein
MKTICRQRMGAEGSASISGISRNGTCGNHERRLQVRRGTKVAQCFKDSDCSDGAGGVCIGYGTRRSQ